ncbi:MAG: hypothetical protein KGL03_05235 [Nitrospirota bacterium]|nr:hypothetical protein [Nitrospirota bacterium]
MKTVMHAGRLALLLVLIGLVAPSGIALAGERQKNTEVLLQYELLKARMTEMMDKIRTARLAGHTVDRKPRLDLRKDLLDFCFGVRKDIQAQGSAAHLKKASAHDPSNLIAITYACEAMEKMLEVEYDLQQSSLQTADNLRKIQERYEDIWKLADSTARMSPEGHEASK